MSKPADSDRHPPLRDPGTRRSDRGLITAIVVLSVLVAAGPTLVGLANVLPSLVLALALAAAMLRLVWFVTPRRAS
jgi:hypothetical protein